MTLMKIFIALFITLFSISTEGSVLPDLRQQHAIRQEWLKARLERVLPALMRKHGVEMWVVIAREYNEDPVFFSLTSPDTFAARRRTIYIFHDRGEKLGVERLALGGGANEGLYKIYRDPQVENRELWGESQWALLRKLVDEKKPRNIAVNISRTHAFSDGLTAGEYEGLQQALGKEWTEKLTRAEMLPLEFIETRIPEMEPSYRKMMELVHSLISRAFSSEVITPGKTTTSDVVWWLRDQVQKNGMTVWFHPTVRIQRIGATGINPLLEDQQQIIQRGDLLHTDFGITAMGLNTDTQHMGYVLREGETDAPPGLKKALAEANRLQDIVMQHLKPGLTGNDVLKNALAQMEKEGIDGDIYCHPIGEHGHGAGPIIGLWDRQEPIPGRGDVKVIPNSWFSIELGTNTRVPEWKNDRVWIGEEEDAILDEKGIRWVLKRQNTFHLIR